MRHPEYIIGENPTEHPEYIIGENPTEHPEFLLRVYLIDSKELKELLECSMLLGLTLVR